LTNFVPISDLDDVRLDPYLRLRERDLIRRDGLFVAEGEVVLRVLVSAHARFRIRSILATPRRAEAIADVLAHVGPDVPVYIVSQEMMDTVVGFPIHRGVLALAGRGTPDDAAALLRTPALARRIPIAVGLIGLANHDNVGSVFRNAAAFGAHAVLLDGATCDPLYRKSVRVSVGAALVVPFARCASADAMLDLAAEAGWEALALSARGDETLRAAMTAQTACRGRLLLLGTEGDGLPQEVLQRTRRVRIDMVPVLDSLNVAVASGIALYEATT
jgi:tRNA G18 (ribose-2'-O)-methylase SpoU